MSKAYKCDRCGKFYEGHFIDPEEDYVITTKLDASKSKFIDLCPICQNSFNAWIKECYEIDKEDKNGIINKIKAIVAEWKVDIWISYECMRKIADLLEESEDKE